MSIFVQLVNIQNICKITFFGGGGGSEQALQQILTLVQDSRIFIESEGIFHNFQEIWQ